MTKIIAHAGCEGTKAGSLANIMIAIDSKVDCIEIDVRSKGDAVLLSHDPLVEGNEYVTFETVIDLIKSTSITLNCDMKEWSAITALLKILDKFNFKDRVFFTGNIDDQYLLSRGLGFYKNIDLVADKFKVTDGKYAEVLTKEDAIFLIDFYKKSGFVENVIGYNCIYVSMTEEILAIFRENNIPICCWTVDEEEDIDRFLSWKIDYMTTNKIIYATNKKQTY